MHTTLTTINFLALDFIVPVGLVALDRWLVALSQATATVTSLKPQPEPATLHSHYNAHSNRKVEPTTYNSRIIGLPVYNEREHKFI